MYSKKQNKTNKHKNLFALAERLNVLSALLEDFALYEMDCSYFWEANVSVFEITPESLNFKFPPGYKTLHALCQEGC